jgi:hypothetical protein
MAGETLRSRIHKATQIDPIDEDPAVILQVALRRLEAVFTVLCCDETSITEYGTTSALP